MAKSNVYGFVMYEESNPLAKVIDFLTANHFAAVISPVHDSDVWTDEDVKHWRESRIKLDGVGVREGADTWECPTGEMVRDCYGCMVPKTVTKPVPKVGDLKKPHRHVYIQFDYSAPLDTALRALAPINITYLEVIRSRRGFLRYLCHIDNPDKAQYRREDVISLGGVDISCLWSQDDGEKFVQDAKIMDLIRRHRFHSIHRLMSYLSAKNYRLMYAEVKAHYGYWSQMMRGAYYVVERHDAEPMAEGEGAEDSAA